LQDSLVSLGLLLLLAVREWQHHKTVKALLDRLMIKQGYEPLTVTEDATMKREPPRMEWRRKESILANAGAVHFKTPGVNP
jgi:hypothetical protein